MIDGGQSLQATEATGQPWQATVRSESTDSPALASVWARGQVRKLGDRYLVEGGRAGLERRIVETSLRYGVLSRFTAYVAVDRSAVVNEGGEGRQIVQPVESPAGWAETESVSSCLMAMPMRASPPPPSPVDPENLESVDSMLAEFTDTAIDFTERESDRRLSEPSGEDEDLAQEYFGLVLE